MIILGLRIVSHTKLRIELSTSIESNVVYSVNALRVMKVC
jgi:hypothetical protein